MAREIATKELVRQEEMRRKGTAHQWQWFVDSGLLFYVNQVLHLFGVALVCTCSDDGKILHVGPRRNVQYRGFSGETQSKKYTALTELGSTEMPDLLKTVQEEETDG